jgi:hypothetical protein
MGPRCCVCLEKPHRIYFYRNEGLLRKKQALFFILIRFHDKYLAFLDLEIKGALRSVENEVGRFCKSASFDCVSTC